MAVNSDEQWSSSSSSGDHVTGATLGQLLIYELIHYVEEPGVTLMNTLDLPRTLRSICKHTMAADDASEQMHRVSSALEIYERRRTGIRSRALVCLEHARSCEEDLMSGDIMQEVIDQIEDNISTASATQTSKFLDQHAKKSINETEQPNYSNKDIDVIQQVLILAENGENSNTSKLNTTTEELSERMLKIQTSFDKLGIT